MAIHLEPPGITWNHLEKLGTTPGITWNNLALHLKPPGTTWHYISQKEHRKYTFCQWKEWNHLIVTTTWHHMIQVIQVPHYPKVYCVLKNKNSQMQTDHVTVKQGRLFCFLVSTVCDHSGLLWCHAPEKSKCSRIPRFCLQGKGQKGQADAASFSRSRYSQHQRKYTICCFLKCQYQIRWNANKHVKFIF